MNHPRRPLRINVGFLINAPIGTSRDFSFEYPEVVLSQDLLLTNFKGVAHISRTPQGLLVEAEFEGKHTAECVRCLEEYHQLLHATYTELFAFKFRRSPESELIVPEDGHIDLGILTRDYLIVEMPIKPVCRPECKGLCMICGTNLNESTCEHQGRVELEE